LGHVARGQATDWLPRQTCRLPAGDYFLDPQPVTGLIGTAPGQSVTVQAHQFTDVTVDYDTGIS